MNEARSLPPPPQPKWAVRPPADPVQVDELAASLRLPPVLCSLLVARGLSDPDEAKAFLRPRLEGLHAPETLPDLPAAVSRILRAIDAGERILIHGDYDVDGMTGTALLVRWLERLGGKVSPFIPHRSRDGYDLGPAGLAAAASAGASLLVTVDCGILASEAVEEARATGLDVIVTDHHMPGERLPPALAVLNPKRSDSRYPSPDLCGTGVAFKLCQGLARGANRPQEELYPYLDLVGLATIADLVPLTGENRILARFGLRALAETGNEGLRALMAEAGVSPGALSAGSIGYVLAPRLNAIGRLGDPSTGLRLLLTDDPGEARRLAAEAGRLNQERQALDRRMADEAMDLLAGSYDPARDYGVVLASDGWHPGVIGIVASRVVERVYRPAVLLALDGDRGRGSARSIPEFHVFDGIKRCADHLDRFGGHKQAAGLELSRDRIDAFRACFNRAARELLEGEDLRPVLRVDLQVDLGDLSDELHHFLGYLGPHGIGNPRPLFMASALGVGGPPRVVGRDHLKLTLKSRGGSLDAIGFQMARRVSAAGLPAGPVEAVFQLHENEFRGVRRLQAHLKDLRPGRPAPDPIQDRA